MTEIFGKDEKSIPKKTEDKDIGDQSEMSYQVPPLNPREREKSVSDISNFTKTPPPKNRTLQARQNLGAKEEVENWG